MDLALLTDGWPYDEHEDAANVRKVNGVDGYMKIQVRIRNGIIQWEAKGRPDGAEPYGCASVLEHCENMLARGASVLENFNADLIDELILELFDFYRRSQALFRLGDYDLALSDVDHALRILTILRRHGPERSFQFDQYRPGLVLERARAEMMAKVRAGHVRLALEALNRGIKDVESFYLDYELDEEIAGSAERQALIELRRSLRERHTIPLNDRELLQSLRTEQEVAIRRENYEMAARLRDKIDSVKQRITSEDS
ncbi:MAG: UvrB/UvrC motif-containing protein [Planctomycetes bacterium]|nr:UvrB/UvrC motif-containing protein [Planctomycetota bacterium]